MVSISDEFSKINDLIKNMKNWYVVPLFKYGLIKKANFVTRNGNTVLSIYLACQFFVSFDL